MQIFKMSSKTYDMLKDLVLILSGLGTLYFALSNIWGWPYGEQINGTVVALVAFLSGLLKVSRHYYYKPLPVDVSGLKYLEEDDEEEIIPEEDKGIVGDAKDVM